MTSYTVVSLVAQVAALGFSIWVYLRVSGYRHYRRLTPKEIARQKEMSDAHAAINAAIDRAFLSSAKDKR